MNSSDNPASTTSKTTSAITNSTMSSSSSSQTPNPTTATATATFNPNNQKEGEDHPPPLGNSSSFDTPSEAGEKPSNNNNSNNTNKSVFGKISRKLRNPTTTSNISPPAAAAATTTTNNEEDYSITDDQHQHQHRHGLSRIAGIRGPKSDRVGRPGSVTTPDSSSSSSPMYNPLDVQNNITTKIPNRRFSTDVVATTTTTTAAAAAVPPPTTLRTSRSAGAALQQTTNRSSLTTTTTASTLPTVHSSRTLTSPELLQLGGGGEERSNSLTPHDLLADDSSNVYAGGGGGSSNFQNSFASSSYTSNTILSSSIISTIGNNSSSFVIGGGGYNTPSTTTTTTAKQQQIHGKGSGGGATTTHIGFDLTDATQLHAAMSSGLLSSKQHQQQQTKTSNATSDNTNASTAPDVSSATAAAAATPRVHRRFGVGDKVLICNHQSRWSNLVNKYGFPDREGTTPEEQRGPYVYVLAYVTKVHFEEDAQYYTVRRADTGVEQRADAEWMEPIRSKRGEAAALKAAQETNTLPSTHQGKSPNQTKKSGLSKFFSAFLTEGEPWYIQIFLCIVKPIFFLLYALNATIGRGVRVCSVRVYGLLRGQALLLLNGMSPYSCSVRLTGVNLLVVCSTWYTLIDQLRLAYIPASADKAIAIISCVVWFILCLELFFEVFIRPDGYTDLIVSDKAYEPSTVRNINTFHVVIETISLAFFLPEILCLFTSYDCGDRPGFSLLNATIMSVIGPARVDAFYGRAFLAIIRLRIFGLVRHWKQMWINNTYVNVKRKKNRCAFFIPTGRGKTVHVVDSVVNSHPVVKSVVGADMNNESERLIEQSSSADTEVKKRASAYDRDDHLTNVTTIGTALMVVNSHRALMIIGAIIGLFPMLVVIREHGGANIISTSMVEQLQGTNLIANSSDTEYCKYLGDSVNAWLSGVTKGKTGDLYNDVPYVLWLQILPVRCDFQGDDGVITQAFCDGYEGSGAEIEYFDTTCDIWGTSDEGDSVDDLTSRAGIRPGVAITRSNSKLSTLDRNGTISTELYNTTAIFQENESVQPANEYSFILQLILLVFILFGLSVLRADAARLVLGPLRRMLKIVSLYAKNPLSPAPTTKNGKKGAGGTVEENSVINTVSDSDDDDQVSRGDKLGNFETEQLISAITKITDLLRKCWGVAGAGIVSSNLARQKDGQTAVFNPCVPGKSVYALFGFCGIKGFDHQLRALQGEIMNLINDVAAVLHKEVYRWGFGDSGQCNKNLGAAFLMVFRIGDVAEVREKRDRARDVIFDPRTATKARPKSTAYRRKFGNKNTNVGSNISGISARSAVVREKKKTTISKPNPKDSLSLASLPGISTFTDRAVIGMLKTYAGIYRDQKLLNWKNDFRLGMGVGAFSVDMIFGMDAGWAVEGAVGSEYKIDATYLSPHVNMASRMMSACKQYGVSILLSQAVGELLSDIGKKKLRHLDTVTVKGSSVKQRIYTYDARHKGVNFFLHERTEEQADAAAERYAPSIWETDPDLRAMRQHVTDDFVEKFNAGRAEYLAGNWPSAITYLKSADDLMVQNVMEQGYVDDDLNDDGEVSADDIDTDNPGVRNEMGDGPSRRLIAVMESMGGIAPKDWKGYRPLTSK